jgi:hypothetical protein
MNNFVRELNFGTAEGNSNPDIKGSRYLKDEFEKGEVYYGGKYMVKDVLLRYNLYDDVMEFKTGNKIMNLDPSMNLNKVVIGDDAFINFKKTTDGISGFVKIRNSQFPSIVTTMKSKLIEKEAVQGFAEPKPVRFERQADENFLMKNDNEVERIKSLKKLIESLGDLQSELSTYAKKEKISTNDPEELAKLLNYYNSLKVN